MHSSTHRVAAVQTEPRFGELEANLAALDDALRGVEADLIVLPELCSTGYTFLDRAEAHAHAETFPSGPLGERLCAWSKRTGGMIVAGFAERDGDAVYNAAAIVAAGQPLGVYRKLHLFGFERECFDRGQGPLRVFEHAGLRVGVMICFDWIFPEAARALALGGADVIAHPSNLVLPGWCQQAMLVRALENRVFTVTANRVGREHRDPRPALAFTGTSRIAGPDGRPLADGPEHDTTVLTASIDTAVSRCKTLSSGNDLFVERRPELYGRWSDPNPQ
ncbi:MAG: acyltransferase [Planctomycetota bacterium]|nr:acyltransferase [Planctomycetota bacterium]